MRRFRLKFCSTAVLVVLSVVLVLYSVPHFTAKKATPTDSLSAKLHSLRAQLRYSELRLLQKQAQLDDLLNQSETGESTALPVQLRAQTGWRDDLRLPTAFELLNYLKTAKQVQPHRLVRSSKPSNEPFRLVVGVPTVMRTRDIYVHDTLNSLLAGVDNSSQSVLVVVAVAPIVNITAEQTTDLDAVNVTSDSVDNETYAEDQLVQELSVKYGNYIESGNLELLVVPRSYYPKFSLMNWQLGDGPVRSTWRMKQALDAAYLMMYARFRGIYYLHLEDDVIAKRDYAERIDEFIAAQEDDDWFVLQFSRLGFIGKLFRTRDLDVLSQYILLFFPFKPVDWLLEYLLDTMVCSPERDMQHCWTMKKQLRRTSDTSLFQHVGHFSSLDGKVQKLQDGSFGKVELFRGHRNPLAEVTSSITSYKDFTARTLYEGSNYFWGVDPQANQSINIEFLSPIILSGFYFHSGNPEHPSDKCLYAVIEVRYVRSSTSSSGYVQIGNFDKYGEARSSTSLASAPIGPLAALRVRITQTHPNWIIINEALIKHVP